MDSELMTGADVPQEASRCGARSPVSTSSRTGAICSPGVGEWLGQSDRHRQRESEVERFGDDE
jgi:hypothetical protein